jgi:tripartite-type tricarboxylate transporter receptor subunit TctC
MRRFALVPVTFFVLLFLVATTFAAYPEKPLTIIVPFAAGGGTDVLIRQFAKVLEKYYPQPIVIDNVPGAGSATGLTKLYNSKPDGYTIGVPGTHLLTAELSGFTSFSWKELRHIAVLNTEPYVLAVRKTSRWQTIQDLLDEATKKPFTITIGTAGAGTLTDIVANTINHKTPAKFVIVPMQGGAGIRTGVLGGHIDVGIFSATEVLPYVGPGGEMRALGTIGEHRVSLFPDVPCFGELGYKGIPAGSVRGLAFPPKVPDDIFKTFESMVLKAVNDPEWIEYTEKNGYVKTFYTGEELIRFYEQTYETLKQIMKEMGLIK